MNTVPPRTHLDRRNVIVDHWLRRLCPLEMAVLLVYDRHAGADATAWPSNDRIKELVGHNQARHIRRARQTLVSLNLLQFVGRHPAHHSDIYRVTLFTPNEREGADSGHPAPIPGTLPENGAPCPDSAPGGAPIPPLHPAPIPGTEGDKEGIRKGSGARGKAKGAARTGVTVARKKPAGPHPEAVAYFCDRWQAQYGAKYLFEGGRDGKHVSAILGHLAGNLVAFRATVDTYFADPDAFLARSRHPIGLLRSQLNRFTPAGETSPDVTAWTPRTLTPQERAEIARPPLPGEPGHPDTIDFPNPARNPEPTP